MPSMVQGLSLGLICLDLMWFQFVLHLDYSKIMHLGEGCRTSHFGSGCACDCPMDPMENIHMHRLPSMKLRATYEYKIFQRTKGFESRKHGRSPGRGAAGLWKGLRKATRMCQSRTSRQAYYKEADQTTVGNSSTTGFIQPVMGRASRMVFNCPGQKDIAC